MSATAPLNAAPAPVVAMERHGEILLLVLNRPQARNGLSEQLIVEITQALHAAGNDAAVRAVVIAGNGPAFSAGHDLKELTARRTDADNGRAYFHHIMTLCADMMMTIVTLPKPVIAAVEGIATAAGCQLVASCDLAVAAADARFATPGVNIGLFCSTPMVALTRNVPRKQAMEMLLTGEMIDADTARAYGLINRIVTPGSARATAIEWARTIAKKSASTLKIGKEAFYRQADMSLPNAYRYAAEVMTLNMMTDDAREGISAFIEKRHPTWQGS